MFILYGVVILIALGVIIAFSMGQWIKPKDPKDPPSRR